MSSSVSVRRARARDIDVIYDVIRPFWQEGLILERTRDDIRHSLDHFRIALFDGILAGVISYHDYGKHLKEIRSLAVKKEYSRRGIGSRLVKSLVRSLKTADSPKIFVLSYSPVFFEKNHFTRVDKETLPEKIWKDCINCKDADKCGETALVYMK
ncbi:MAG: GNAT family N-acetyltransferase [Spirochaetes bacterium]|nr:GNAT family N-acetyltransferase [Spirochaetota bacterium]